MFCISVSQSITTRVYMPKRRKYFNILHKYLHHSCCSCTLTKTATTSCRCKISLPAASFPLPLLIEVETLENGFKFVYNFLRERRKRCLEDLFQNMLRPLPFFNPACKIRHKAIASIILCLFYHKLQGLLTQCNPSTWLKMLLKNY